MPNESFILDIDEEEAPVSAADAAQDAAQDADDEFTYHCNDGSEEFTLEGYGNLREGSSDPNDEEDEAVLAPAPKRARPAFYSATTKAAERAALRTKVEAANSFLLEEEGETIQSYAPRVPGTWGRRQREDGTTLPAYHKKITHDLDADDELMLEMREKGFSDKQIAEKLAKDGSVRYDTKSVSTRIARIRQAQACHVDWLLEEGYMEWRLEDDQLLIHAFDLADIEVRYEIERIRALRFRKTAEWMRRLNKDSIFSASACRARYMALVDGTASIPVDEADDPHAARLQQQLFCAQREAARNAEAERKAREAAEVRRIKDEARARQAQKSASIAARRENAAVKKAARAMHRAAQAQLKSQRAVENNTRKKERNDAIIAKREADSARKQYLGRMKEFSPRTIGRVTEDTPDPRARVSRTDLRGMCAERNLPARSNSKSELIKILRKEEDKLNTTDLRRIIKDKGISLGGDKLMMQYQLALFAAKNCDSYREESDGEDDEQECGDDF